MHSSEHDHAVSGFYSSAFAVLPFVLLCMFYLTAVWASNRRFNKWPLYRSICFMAGVSSAAAALIGPVADRAQTDFEFHMWGHLLLGMASPLFLVLSSPMTLALRSLPVSQARKLSRLLTSSYMRIVSHPVSALILNIGGLWVLYATDLYILMHENMAIHFAVHIHVFLAGYMMTASLIYLDPVSHRYSFSFRAAILVTGLAGHGILSKYIYANPPSGVSSIEAERGGIIMYYGGDAIELLVILILCSQWFKRTWPRAEQIPPGDGFKVLEGQG